MSDDPLKTYLLQAIEKYHAHINPRRRIDEAREQVKAAIRHYLPECVHEYLEVGFPYAIPVKGITRSPRDPVVMASIKIPYVTPILVAFHEREPTKPIRFEVAREWFPLESFDLAAGYAAQWQWLDQVREAEIKWLPSTVSPREALAQVRRQLMEQVHGKGNPSE